MKRIKVPAIPPVYVTITSGSRVRQTMITAGILKIAAHAPFTVLLESSINQRQQPEFLIQSFSGNTYNILLRKVITRIGTADTFNIFSADGGKI